MITKVINVNLHQPIYEKLTAKQGDIASRYLLFHLLDGDKPFDLNNRSVRVYAIKPDKTEIFNDLTINDASKGYCTLELTSQCLASAGVVKMELYISESGKVLTSIPFELEVIACINTANGVTSTNEFSALEAALGSLQDYDNLRSEIVQARKGYTTVGKRLDNVDSQLDTKTNLGYFYKEKEKEYKWNRNATLDEYYNLFDSLATPSRLNYTVLGKDQSNTYDIRLYDYKPQNYNSTVFVTCALHGWEHLSTYTMYEVFKTLLNDKELPQQYESLRDSRILCIPVANPWGLMAHNHTGEANTRRGNSRGVDLNRNFDYRWEENSGGFGLGKGESPFSEAETKLIKKVFDDYEISFYIDIHSFFKTDTRKYLFYSNPETVDMTHSFINWLNETYGTMNIELTTAENDSSVNNYANKVRKTRTCNIELIYDTDDTVNNNCRKWHECIINYLSLATKNFKLNNYLVDNGAKFAQRFAENIQTIEVSTDWTVLDNLTFSYDVSSSGIFEVTGYVCVEITGGDDTTSFTITPSIDQPLYYSPKSIGSRTRPFIKNSSGTNYLPFNCSMYVKKGMGQAKFQLEMIKEGTGIVTVKRSDAIYKFIPCNASYVQLEQHIKNF